MPSMTKADISPQPLHLARPLNIRQILAPGGPIEKAFPGFENRPQQLQMAQAVHQAFAEGRHLVTEAGTGIGKSFAYLIPAIDILHKRTGKVLISTFTITLQEQLTNKDIPFLQNCLPCSFKAVLAKGRGNYLCKRRLQFTLKRQKLLFDHSASVLEAINNWAGQTKDGSLSDIPFIPDSNIWDKVNSEHGNCRKRNCPHFRDCFYQRARRRLDSADIIVTNHALMFSDLVLKQQGAAVLPDYKYIVIDEAQNIEHVAEEHFGINISHRRINLLLNNLYNPRTHKGVLTFKKADDTIDTVALIAKEAKKFFDKVAAWFEDTKAETAGRCYKNFVDDNISGHLKILRSRLSGLANSSDDTDEKFELIRFANRCADLLRDIDCFLNQQKPDYLYWVEPPANTKANISLRSAPLNVGPDVKNCLFDKYQSVILTSATLSTGQASDKKGFDFFAGRIGLDDFHALKLGSPFNYQRQVTLYIEKDLPSPNDPAFIDVAAKAIKKYVLKTAGRAFVLFTSYEMLDAVTNTLADWLAENNIVPLRQGVELDRTNLLKKFKSEKNSVLFGTDSFWQGVDVPGQTLSNVIIVRLPFAVPDQPLLAGRLQQIKQKGGEPFLDYQLPSAIIKFRQGFGRLIRNKTDTGIVVVLDSRIINKSYGQRFLNAIPKCKTKIVTAKK